MTQFNRTKALAAAFLVASGGACLAQILPPALQALQKRGISVLDTFPSKTGLKAYAAMVDGRPVAFYVAPDGHVIAGAALGEDGKGADEEALDAVARRPLGEQGWKQLDASHWIADGKPTAPRVVYMFTDPNCPYCAKFWNDARPWVDSGKVQLRHVIVGILTPTSRAKAAALLADKNPSEALAAYEGVHAPATATKLAAGGQARPLGDQGLKPLTNVSPDLATQLDENKALMSFFGLQGTPGLLWRDVKGSVQKRTGASGPALYEILGPL
jgi:thiol:disulfide interchange protein DsbG